MQSLEKRRNKAQENRETIPKAAISLFQKHGFENVTIDEIGKEAGFLRGTVYKLFVSKEDLVVSYMTQWNRLYENYYHEEIENSEQNALEKIRSLVQYMLSASTKGGQAFQRIAIASGMKDDLFAEKISKSNASITKIFQDLLSYGQNEGLISSAYSVSELIEMIYIVLEGLCLRWAGSYNDRSLEEISGPALNILIETLKNKN